MSTTDNKTTTTTSGQSVTTEKQGEIKESTTQTTEPTTTQPPTSSSTTKTVEHTVTKEDVELNTGEGLTEGEKIEIPSEDGFSISSAFASALAAYHASLPEGYTVNVHTDAAPQLEIISFDKSIPNSPRHIENLRVILVKNNNTYGAHKRFVGTEAELIEQLNQVING